VFFCEMWVETENPAVYEANKVVQPDGDIHIDKINED